MMSRTSSPTPWHALSNKLFLLVLCFLCCGAARQQANPEVLLKLDDITGPWFSAKGISARLATQGKGRFEAQVAEFTLFDRTVRHLKITCAQFRMIGHELNCGDGAVHLDTVTPLTFVYSTKSKTLELNFRPGQVEAWRVFASHGDKNRFMTLSVGNGVASRYNQWIPESWPRIASGRIFGYFEVSEEAGRMQAKMNFSVQDFSFSDAASRHAGEKIAAVVSAELQGSGQTWRWKSEVEWQAGQVYWHPVYFPGGGHKFVVDGAIEKDNIDLRHARLTIAGIGELQATGRWSRPRSEIDDLTVWTDNVKLGALHEIFLRPFVEDTPLAQAQARGDIGFRFSLRGRRVESVDFTLRNASIRDLKDRYRIDSIDAHIPWSLTQATEGKLAFGRAHVGEIGFGPIEVPLRMQGYEFAIPKAVVPILDGQFAVTDVRAKLADSAWEWEAGGEISGITMEKLSAAMKWPVMTGGLDVQLNRVRYSKNKLQLDGGLLFRIFNGYALLQNVEFEDPFGAGVLSGDLAMHNLDLGMMTRTFKLGAIEGRIDVGVHNFRMVDWKPVQFDASVLTSPGDFRKRISQRAVDNISSLGGGGAGKALQRTVLRIFSELSYEKIGLSCALREGECTMGGAEDVGEGFYIIKAGGVPSVSIVGHNRKVPWEEMLDRFRQVMEGNSRAVVR